MLLSLQVKCLPNQSSQVTLDATDGEIFSPEDEFRMQGLFAELVRPKYSKIRIIILAIICTQWPKFNHIISMYAIKDINYLFVCC